MVVDDAAAAIDLVTRGDDLLPSTPSQVAIGRALGVPAPRYAHVGMVVGPDGKRLAKRDGAITVPELGAVGLDAAAVRSALAVSIGIADLGEPVTAPELVGRGDCHHRSPRGRSGARRRPVGDGQTGRLRLRQCPDSGCPCW